MDLKGLAPMSSWSNRENSIPKNEAMVNDDNTQIEESEDVKNGENNYFNNVKKNMFR